MPKAVVQTTLEAPTVADIVNVRLAGDFSRPAELRVYAQVVLRDESGAEYRRDTVELDIDPANFVRDIAGDLVRAVGDKLGLTFQ